MKKVLLIGVMLLIAGFTTNAQTFGSGLISKIGIRAGLNLSRYAGHTEIFGLNTDTRFKPGLSAGLFVSVPLSESFSFEPAAEFSQKGTKVKNQSGTGIDITQNVQYIDVPLIAHFQAGPGLSLFLGPQVSFFLDQKTELSGSENGSGITFSQNDDFRKTLIGAKAGIGYIISDFNISASYAHDLQNVIKDDVTGAGEPKNQVINVSLAFRFH